MIKVIGFDLDQTFYLKSPKIDRAVQIQLFREISKINGKRIEEIETLFEQYYQAFKSGSEAIMKILGVSKKGARKLVQTALAKTDLSPYLVPDEKTNSILARLNEKYYLDMITGSPRETMLEKIKSLELPDVFGHLIDGEQGSKSDGTAYELWLGLYNFSPNEFLYIGDEKDRDYYPPKRMGIATILVNVKRKDDSLDCPQLSSIYEIEKTIEALFS